MAAGVPPSRIDEATHSREAFSLEGWIRPRLPELQEEGFLPLHDKGCQFQISIRGGSGVDWHWLENPSELWFWQLEGSPVQLSFLSTARDVPELVRVQIQAGECFLLPGNVPHRVQRPSDSRGVVAQRCRQTGEKDAPDRISWRHSCGQVLKAVEFRTPVEGGYDELVQKLAKTHAPSDWTCEGCGSQGTQDAEAAGDAEFQIPDAEKKELIQRLERVDWNLFPEPLNFRKWITENKGDLKPPVGNKLVYPGDLMWTVMVIGGPNVRTDYHINEGEEWFYMVDGDMVLKIVDGGEFRDVHIREGECFLLPPNIPHSPQRGPGSIGLVLERRRWAEEVDGVRWYCRADSCREIVHEKFFHCGVDGLVVQLKATIEEYYGSDELRTCPTCKTVDDKPG